MNYLSGIIFRKGNSLPSLHVRCMSNATWKGNDLGKHSGTSSSASTSAKSTTDATPTSHTSQGFSKQDAKQDKTEQEVNRLYGHLDGSFKKDECHEKRTTKPMDASHSKTTTVGASQHHLFDSKVGTKESPSSTVGGFGMKSSPNSQPPSTGGFSSFSNPTTSATSQSAKSDYSKTHDSLGLNKGWKTPLDKDNSTKEAAGLNSRNVDFQDMLDSDKKKENMRSGETNKAHDSMCSSKANITEMYQQGKQDKFSEVDKHTRNYGDFKHGFGSGDASKSIVHSQKDKVPFSPQSKCADLNDLKGSKIMDNEKEGSENGTVLQSIQTGAVEASKFVIDNTTNMLNKLRNTIAGEDEETAVASDKHHKKVDSKKPDSKRD